MQIKIQAKEEEESKKILIRRDDVEASRMKRYLGMPDLSRKEGSPLYSIVKKVSEVPELSGLDVIEIPEIVPVEITFDLFDFPADHVARSKSDTYYINDGHILRTHNTVSWYYYFHDEKIIERAKNKDHIGALCFGKVYRKDEIDRRHMNVFHQLDGFKLIPNEEGALPLDELKRVLSRIVEEVFGKDTNYRFLDDTFPYTDPSTQIEVMVNNEWVEILGAGMIKSSVLEKMGIKGYNGWAFGFGLERLAILSMNLPDIRLLWSDDDRVKKQLVLGQKFKEVSKYPAITRDISFIVDISSFAPNNYFDLVRDVVGDMAEEMALVDEYENAEKFGVGKKSYAYRIIYRSINSTLTDDEVNKMHKELEEKTKEVFSATIR